MKLKKYLQDKLYVIGISSLSLILILLMLLAFKVDKQLIVAISIILVFTLVILLLIDYFRKKNFYLDLLGNIEQLDKAYIVLDALSNK